MESFIRFIVSNFTLTFFVLGLIVALIVLWAKPKPLTKAIIVETFMAYYLLFMIGITYFYNFVMHVFFGVIVAHFIGWAQSPFQAEVGFASLGFAVVGFIAVKSKIGFRAATIIAPTFFLWGAAGGHVYQMLVAGNFSPGNAGVVFYSDILIPLIGLCLLWFQNRNPLFSSDNA